MRLLNPLKALTWKSLSRSSRNRLRRRQPGFAPMTVAAEVLEQRALLSNSANLTVTASGTITLTSNTVSNNFEHVNIELTYNAGTHTVEFTSYDGTTLHYNNNSTDYTDDFVDVSFGFSDPKAITVNLGGGHDTFYIDGVKTQGNITFTGPDSGAGTSDGWDVEVFNDTGTAMVVNTSNAANGGIIANLGTATSYNSHFEVYNDSTGGLTVKGSISVTDSADSVALYNEVYNDGSAGMTVTGKVTMIASGGSYLSNHIDTYDNSGSLTINGNVKLTTSGDAEFGQYSSIFTNGNGDGSGALWIKGNVSITSSGGAYSDNELYTYNNGGTLTVNGSVAINYGWPSGDHYTDISTTDGGDMLWVKGTVSIIDAGNGEHTHLIYTDGYYDYDYFDSGNLMVGAVSIIDSGAGYHDTEIFTVHGGGSVTVNGGVSLQDTGNLTVPYGDSRFAITASVSYYDETYDEGGGNITINGSVLYDNHWNTTGSDEVYIGGDYEGGEGGATTSITGSLTLKLSSTPTAGNTVVLGFQEWWLDEESETGKSLTVYGALNVTSGAGADEIYIQGSWIKGLLTVNTGSNADLMDIEGSEFDGGNTLIKNLITMLGSNSELDIADGHGSGWDATFFKYSLQVNMPGSLAASAAINDVVMLGGSGDGLTFNRNLYVYGKGPSTNGTVFVNGSVTFLFNNNVTTPVHSYFILV